MSANQIEIQPGGTAGCQTTIPASAWAGVWRARPEVATLCSLLAGSLAIVLFLAWTVLRPPIAPPTKPVGHGPPLPESPISLDGAAIRGNRAAALAIVEYSDFRCPYCARFAREVLPALERKYVDSGQVLLAFRHLPNDSHPMSREVAAVAACAGKQGKFWDAHDVLFSVADHFDAAVLDTLPARLGLDPTQVAKCLGQQGPAEVADDVATARALHLASTPSFLIGQVQADGRVKVREIVAGAQKLGAFDKALDSVRLRSQASVDPRKN
jgi:protein-disulfide isomerase